MRVIITGGTGLIGRALAEDLLMDGHEVILLSRSPDKRDGNIPAGAQVLGWDGRTSQGWAEAADGAGAIINLAGANLSSKRWSDKQKEKLLESRLNPGRAVVEAVEKAVTRPQVVIQSSAVGYYGTRYGDRQVTEKMAPGKDYLSNMCVEWENSTAPVEQYGIRRAVARIGVVLTSDSIALKRMALPYKLFVGGPLGSGRQWLSWIHLEDQVAALRFLVDNPTASGPFNLTSPTPVTNSRFGKILGRVLKRPSWFPVPAFLIKTLFGEMATVVLDGQRAVPKRLQDLGFKFCYPELESALREIYRK
jgi:uncharacterized protein